MVVVFDGTWESSSLVSRFGETGTALHTFASIPWIVMHSAGIGTTPYGEGFLSPL